MPSNVLKFKLVLVWLEVEGHMLSTGVLCFRVIKPMRESELDGQKYRIKP